MLLNERLPYSSYQPNKVMPLSSGVWTYVEVLLDVLTVPHGHNMSQYDSGGCYSTDVLEIA